MVKLELAEEIEKDGIRLVTSVIHVALRCSTTESLRHHQDSLRSFYIKLLGSTMSIASYECK